MSAHRKHLVLKKLKNLLLLPVWIVSIVTPAKSFRDNVVIGSRILNWLGLHIVRIVVARTIVWLRWTVLAPSVPTKLRRDFHANGFLVIGNFIPAADIDAIRAEIRTHNGETRQMLQGDTATQRFLLDHDALSEKPTLAGLVGSQRFLRPLAYAAAKLTPPLVYVQRIRNGVRDKGPDPQKNMHADTFHPTMKAWLFLEDVPAEKGPFTYVRGSQRLTWSRLKWEYKRSLIARQQPDGYSEKGSFRATKDDLAAMGLPKPEGVCVKAGTLVIANTNGFHGRGHAGSNQSRLEIWAYARPSPFNPLPGLPMRAFGTLQMAMLKAFWRKKDADAARKNSRASWHRIPPGDMTDF